MCVIPPLARGAGIGSSAARRPTEHGVHGDYPVLGNSRVTYVRNPVSCTRRWDWLVRTDRRPTEHGVHGDYPVSTSRTDAREESRFLGQPDEKCVPLYEP